MLTEYLKANRAFHDTTDFDEIFKQIAQDKPQEPILLDELEENFGYYVDEMILRGTPIGVDPTLFCDETFNYNINHPNR